MKGKRSFENVMDLRDALEDVKAQVAFLSYTVYAFSEAGFPTNQSMAISGMCETFDDIENKIDEINEALQRQDLCNEKTPSFDAKTLAEKTMPFCAAIQSGVGNVKQSKATNALGSILDPAPVS